MNFIKNILLNKVVKEIQELPQTVRKVEEAITSSKGRKAADSVEKSKTDKDESK